MSSDINDPNNHVPEVTPGDDWGDPAEELVVHSTDGPVLPPRRSISDKSAAPPKRLVPVPDNYRPVFSDESVRIEPRRPRVPVIDEQPMRLEVTEIRGAVIRLEQELEGPPKVERQTKFHERPKRDEKEHETRGEGREWGSVAVHPVRWIILMGVAIVLLIMGGFLILQRVNTHRGVAVVPPPMDVEDDSGNADAPDALGRMLMMQKEASALYAAFATARKPEDVLPLISSDPDVRQLVIDHWKPLDLPRDWRPPPNGEVWAVDQKNQQSFGSLSGSYPDNSRFIAWFVLENDQLRIDWRATTVYSSATEEELLRGTGDTHEIRGTITPDNFYSIAWSEIDYQCFRLLVSPNGEPIWCYTRRDGETNKRLFKAFTGGEIVRSAVQATRITFSLKRGAENSRPNQWLIDDIAAFNLISLPSNP